MEDIKTHIKYTSCIKIAGIPLLPPLITPERREELNNDKEKAIEIEKKITKKRPSIDSGVMTGSYTESVQLQTVQSNTLIQEPVESDGVPSPKIENNINLSIPDLDSISGDTFLKSALEDSDFREFFYSTAERIFKDNNVEYVNKKTVADIPNVLKDGFQNFDTCNENNQTKQHGTMFPHISEPSNVFDIYICSSPDARQNESLTYNNTLSTINNESADTTVDLLSPPHRRMRRNSYTLESPSPVLLEHIAKEHVNKFQVKEKWASLSDKKTSDKKLGFKTFSSARKPRRTWHIKKNDHELKPSTSLTPNPSSSCKRSRTFVKSLESREENISLPSSSRTSPINVISLSQSSECIQSLNESQIQLINTEKLNTNKNFETLLHLNESNLNDSLFQSYKTISEKVTDSKVAENNSCMINDSQINCDIVVNHLNPENLSCSPSRQSFIVTDQTISNHSDCSLQNSTCITTDIDVQNNSQQTTDIDDIISVCSSLSLPKFTPMEASFSRPSTSEDLSALFSQLQLHHERQIKELLEKQHREKVMITKLHVTNGILSSRCTTNMSNTSDLPLEIVVSPNDKEDGTKTSCSRELFPNDKLLNGVNEQSAKPKNYSQKEKDAALKLTAYVRGYLTRRLLRTEKVQQLIDTIKESLNCAFSLQSESQLRKNDLDLHERLAHQLTAALYELQTIISSPVTTRMGIIATDREKLRKPLSRPSSTISAATQKSILRRQQSFSSNKTKLLDRRCRTKSLCLNSQQGMSSSVSSDKSDSSVSPISISRKPWR